MFGAGVAVIDKEIAYAAISSVDIRTAPILLLVAGILSLSVACLGIYFIKKSTTLNDMGKALTVVVSSIVLNKLQLPCLPSIFLTTIVCITPFSWL